MHLYYQFINFLEAYNLWMKQRVTGFLTGKNDLKQLKLEMQLFSSETTVLVCI